MSETYRITITAIIALLHKSCQHGSKYRIYKKIRRTIYEIRVHKMKKSFRKFNLTYVELFELFPDNETKYEQNCM